MNILVAQKAQNSRIKEDTSDDTRTPFSKRNLSYLRGIWDPWAGFKIEG